MCWTCLSHCISLSLHITTPSSEREVSLLLSINATSCSPHLYPMYKNVFKSHVILLSVYHFIASFAKLLVYFIPDLFHYLCWAFSLDLDNFNIDNLLFTFILTSLNSSFMALHTHSSKLYSGMCLNIFINSKCLIYEIFNSNISHIVQPIDPSLFPLLFFLYLIMIFHVLTSMF